MTKLSDTEKEILNFFNQVIDPCEIVKKIPDDPLYGSSSPRAYGVRISLAEKIIRERDDVHGGSFSSVEDIDRIKGVGKDTLHDIYNAFLKNTTSYPVVLFPVRLETRFKNNQLWVRLYPDDICIESHDRRITKAEAVRLDNLKTIINSDATREEKQAAWRDFVSKFGLPRATYIATLEEKEFVNDEIFAPKVRVLPSRFLVTVYQDGKVKCRGTGNPILDELPLMRTTDHTGAGDAYFDDDSLWVTDFEAAEAVGMAIKLDNCGDGPFDKVVAVGIKDDLTPIVAAQRIEDLFESHKFTKGIGFLRYGTPTNNTNTSEAGYSEDFKKESELSFDSVFSNSTRQVIPNSNLDVFHKVMGIRPDVFKGTDYAQDKQEFYSSALRNALWPGLGDYYMSSMLSSSISKDDRWQLWDHFKNYVYGRGYCPSIRIGKQPYGVLPARSQKGWDVSELDGFENDSVAADPINFDMKLHRIIQRFYGAYWLKMSQSGAIPHVGNPTDLDQELTSILAMSPHSLSYHGRAFIDDRFVAWLLNALGSYFFGENSGFDEASPEAVEYWTSRWATQWSDIENPPDQVLKEIASAIGLNESDLIGPALSNLFSWGDGRAITNTLVRDEGGDRPLAYLSEFNQVPDDLPPANVDKPMFYDFLRRSLAYQRSYDEEERLIPPEIEIQSITYKERYATRQVTHLFVDVGDVFNKDDVIAKLFLAVLPSTPVVPPVTLYKEVKAPEGGRVVEIVSGIGTDVEPQEEIELIRYEPSRPTEERICAAIRAIDNAGIDEAILKGHLVDTFDLLTHRLDAWVTSFANKRILGMRENESKGIHIGAYGYIENLSKDDQATSDIAQGNPGGYIHAPSVGQAATAALLRNAYLTHQNDMDGNAYRVNLSSERVRRAMRIIQGLREAQELPELLGYQLERELHDTNFDLLIDDFRAAYPLVADTEVALDVTPGSDEVIEAIAARNVADGLAIARDVTETGQWTTVTAKLETSLTTAQQDELFPILDNLRDSLDAVNDTLIHESVFHAVQGNYERSGAALEAMNGLNRPPELESIKTPTAAVSLGHRVYMLFEPPPELTDDDERFPRRCAEPRLDEWLSNVLGDFEQIGCTVTVEGEANDVIVRFSNLDLCALDYLSITADETAKSETDLDRYIKYHIRTLQQLTSDVVLSINYDRSSQEYKRSMGEALELLKTIRKVISVDKKYLTPCALSRPEGQPSEDDDEDVYVEDNYTEQDYLELRERIDKIDGLFENALDDVDTDAVFVADHYFNLSRFKIIEALPVPPPETNEQYLEFKQSIVEQAKKVVKKADVALAETDAFVSLETPDYNKAIKKLREVAQILLGENFVILPSCTPSNDAELNPAFSYSDTLINQNPENVNLWLQQVAEVNPRIQQLEDMLLTQSAWQSVWVSDETDSEHAVIEIQDQADYQFHVAQLPDGAFDRWMALPDSEQDFSGLEERPRSITSFVCYSGNDTFSSLQDVDYSNTRISGLVIDAWDEKIPQFGQEDDDGNRVLPTQQTGISFQYDRPNAQAPQTILLAVPDTHEEEATDWQLEALREIVCETMDLAKTRSVDLDAFTEIGGVFPGLYLPVDADTPGWVRDVVVDSLEDLVVESIPCANLDSYYVGTGLGPKFDDDLGMVLASTSGGDALIPHPPPGSYVFNPDGISLSWSPDAEGELIITISQISGLRSEPVPEINAYDAGGNIVKSGFGPSQYGGYRRFTIDLDRAVRIEMSGGYHSPSQSYRYYLRSICVLDPKPALPIEEGAVFNGYLVKTITLNGAPAGDYTFRQHESTDGIVYLLRDGNEVMQLSYDWQTIISFDNPYRFSFAGHFDIDIGRQRGTSNLYGLKRALFDGRQYLHVD